MDPSSGYIFLSLKYFSLVALTAQKALDAVVVRYSRTRTGDLYFTSSATVTVEVLKLVGSLFLLSREERGSAENPFRRIWDPTSESHGQLFHVAVICIVYVAQNNLSFIAASHLDVVTYQVTCQLKLLTAAIFSVLVLQKKLSALQWLSLFILVMGVTEVNTATAGLTIRTENDLPEDGASPSSTFQQQAQFSTAAVGLTAVLLASLLSGFGGVYFEKVLKASTTSVWLWNVQLSLLSIPMSLLYCFIADAGPIKEKGFFFGYDRFVWLAVANKAFGGLVIALVMRYADNIVKGFALAIAIIFGGLANMLLFEVPLNVNFAIGACLVIAAVFMYGQFGSTTSKTNTSLANGGS